MHARLPPLISFSALSVLPTLVAHIQPVRNRSQAVATHFPWGQRIPFLETRFNRNIEHSRRLIGPPGFAECMLYAASFI